MSRYRRLRGMVIHALPRLRNLGIPEGRQLIRLDMLPPRKSTGRCHWCRLPIEDKGKRFWDIDWPQAGGRRAWIQGISQPQLLGHLRGVWFTQREA